MSKTVLLTGITGFIAKRIAFDLLQKGYTVKGSLRSERRKDEVLAALSGVDTSRLSFVSLDLTSDDGWDTAMDGVDVLMHTASPFPMASPKDENEIIRPAVDGTLRAVKAAQKAGVNRVVLTSSMVAIMHVDRPDGHKFGPSDWTDLSHPTSSAYVKSKTMAEKAAWDFVAQHPEMSLTTIHPGVVWGTPMDRHFGTSLELVERILSAKDPMQPNIGFPVVDVKDVSALHIAAMENDTTAGQRIIASESHWMMPNLAQVLADAYPDRKIKTKIAPKFLLRLMGLFDPAIKTVVPLVGRDIEIDNSSGHALLGEFVDAKTSMLASADYVETLGA
ncbi:MAG: NAD-dependent epimerase/dehydratase family protein [Planktomarina sp.]